MAVASSRSLRFALLALCVPAQSAFGFTALGPVVGGRQRAPSRTATLLPPHIARPVRSGTIFAVASIPAVAHTAALHAPCSLASRLARALLCTLATVLATTCRCLAVTASKTVSSTATPLVTANTLKWGAVGLLAGAAFFVNSDKSSDSGFQNVEQGEAPTAPLAAPPAAADADNGVDAEPKPIALDDSSIASALSVRMAQLAKESAEQQQQQDKAPPANDSTDEWGTGNTAVLEPPRPKADDDSGPSVGPTDGPIEFPVGWPLVDAEDVKPAASDDDIAMLERMFGPKSDP